MIPADQDHGVQLQKRKDKSLHLNGFLAAVEDIAQDDQLVQLRIGEIPRLIQRLMKFGIKAVNIGGNEVFHRLKLDCQSDLELDLRRFGNQVEHKRANY